jgi:hypothetical protein
MALSVILKLANLFSVRPHIHKTYYFQMTFFRFLKFGWRASRSKGTLLSTQNSEIDAFRAKCAICNGGTAKHSVIKDFADQIHLINW